MRKFEAYSQQQLDDLISRIEERVEYHSARWQRWSDYLAEVQAEKIMREN